MPSAIKTRCRHPGCGVPCHGGYCEQHRRDQWQIHDHRRGNAAERGYDEAWRQIARRRRELDNYLCQVCLNKHERVIAAKIVDHIIPLHVRPDWRLELRNLQVLCHACHQAKTEQDTKRYGSSNQHTPSLAQQRARRTAEALPPPRGCPGAVIFCGIESP